MNPTYLSKLLLSVTKSSATSAVFKAQDNGLHKRHLLARTQASAQPPCRCQRRDAPEHGSQSPLGKPSDLPVELHGRVIRRSIPPSLPWGIFSRPGGPPPRQAPTSTRPSAAAGSVVLHGVGHRPRPSHTGCWGTPGMTWMGWLGNVHIANRPSQRLKPYVCERARWPLRSSW